MKSRYNIFILICLMAFAISCDDNEDSTTGKASISITDAPIDDENVAAVYITINSVEVNGPDGWKTLETFEEPVTIDLLSYQNGEAYFLTENSIKAGAYNEVRLMLDIQEKVGGVLQNEGCYIEYLDGSVQPLFVPSGGQSGYKAKGDFDVPAGGVVAVTLDFDVRKAIVKAGNSGKYILKPTVRLVANADAGMIEGTFDSGEEVEKTIVFAYADNSFDISETDEPADGEVRFSNATTSSVVAEGNSFTLAFMNTGTYDLYFASYDANGEFVELLGSYEDAEVGAGSIVELELDLSLIE